MAPLHVVSWNVAGWKTTVAGIRQSFGSLEAYLDLMKIDILCLQEAKVARKKLETKPNDWHSKIKGWDSFWACCKSSEKKDKTGYAGVTTYARKGLTVGANAAPLGPEVDNEGRCIMTDHGDFVIFNIYAPNNGPKYKRLGFKMKFYNALRAKMDEVRQSGKHVILLGDFNLNYKAEDISPSRRLVHVRELFSKENPYEIPEEMHRLGDKFFTALDKIEVVKVPGDPSGKRYTRKYDVYKIVLNQKDNPKPLELCDRTSCELVAEKRKSLEEIRGECDLVVKPEGYLPIGLIKEIFEKALDHPFPGAVISRLTKHAISSAPPVLQDWVKGVIKAGMVDTFAHFYLDVEKPHKKRFTCWDQYKNCRYSNAGSRIDFMLVDKALFEKVVSPTRPIQGGSEEKKVDQSSEMASLLAATAFGGWQPAPFEGGGMVEPTQRVYEIHVQPPSTGLIYTPPKWSDHIACSLLLDARPENLLEMPKAKATKWAQPQFTLKSITSFFGKSTGPSDPFAALTKPKPKKKKPASGPFATLAKAKPPTGPAESKEIRSDATSNCTSRKRNRPAPPKAKARKKAKPAPKGMKNLASFFKPK